MKNPYENSNALFGIAAILGVIAVILHTIGDKLRAGVIAEVCIAALILSLLLFIVESIRIMRRK